MQSKKKSWEYHIRLFNQNLSKPYPVVMGKRVKKGFFGLPFYSWEISEVNLRTEKSDQLLKIQNVENFDAIYLCEKFRMY